jgi:hypothetical protein
MSKTDQPSFDKSSIPPTPPLLPQRETVKHLSLPRRETLIYGARECDFTTVSFIIHPQRGVDDLLMIGLDEHHGEQKSRLMVRGGAEAREIPSQLRWIANKIEKEIGKHEPLAVNEYVVNTVGA